MEIIGRIIWGALFASVGILSAVLVFALVIAAAALALVALDFAATLVLELFGII